FKFSSILIILPGAGYREKSKELIFKQFKYLIKEKIGLCIVNFRNCDLKKRDIEFFEFIKEYVAKVRGIIKFIAENFVIEDINVIGISFGGIIGFIVCSIEERIKRSIFLISGANFEYITWKSLLRFILKKDCKRNVCKRMHKIYKKFIDAKLYEEIENLPRKCFLYDPFTYLENLKGKDILMINGLFDMIIPFYSVLEIKKRLKNCKILWYPGTHLTLKYFFPFFKKSILKFLKDGYKCRC
ncbi:MAG: hypothetical protein NC833_05520, partial [Candidatus Omnitrophica bacterium]|nr:hypothetical protein [Candidatus Omnitrophota bacterium]